jgi:DNA primase
MNDLFIQELKNRAGLSSVISRYVRLAYKNGHYMGCCPFHKEKTPSFTVNDAKGFYHCFGCNAGGDVIAFLQNYLSISFGEAVSELCLQTNTPLPKFQKEEKNTDLEVLAQALILMQNELKKSPNAMMYLKKRGIDDSIITHFGIGFCPPSKDFLFKNLRANFSEQDILNSGLCIKSSYNSQIVDRFPNRIMFAIYSHSAKVIGFSGRIFCGEENVAKYINSPETELFKKSQIREFRGCYCEKSS